MYSKPSQRKTAETLSTKSRASAPGCPLRSGASEATEFFTKGMVTNEKRPVHKLSGAEQGESTSVLAPAMPRTFEKVVYLLGFVEATIQSSNRSSRSPGFGKATTRSMAQGSAARSSTAPISSPSTSPLMRRPKPPAGGSRSKRSASTRSRTTRSLASSSSTMASGNGTSHWIG